MNTFTDTDFYNPILNTDSYKLSHYLQYPPNTKNIFSYIEPRGSNLYPFILNFGLQAFLLEYMSKPITMEQVEFAASFAEKHGEPFNKDGWTAIVKKHKGILPLRIRAVPEGSLTRINNVVLTVENTDDEFAWLTSYVEPKLLRGIWYTSTVATISMICKKYIYESLLRTSDDPDTQINFKLHDFGLRGVNSMEGAAMGGMAHIVNFSGTDTITGILAAMKYYNSDVCAYSIPAAEHSTITSWGRENEMQAYENMVNQYAKAGKIFAVVIDSYDMMNAAVEMWYKGGLLERVKNAGATVVLRPDSGDPTIIPVELIKTLMNNVGYTVNSKGFKVLPSHVRVIQGDGITINSLPQIISNLEKNKLSMDNLAFGMGAGLLQKCDRDTFKWAMKCSAATIDSTDIDVFKDPITDKTKNSKKGRITLAGNGNTNTLYASTIRLPLLDGFVDLLRTVYENGIISSEIENFETIRARALSNFKSIVNMR